MIDYSVVPGTGYLIDESKTKKDIILIPTPSDDPNDPLNWSRGRKNLHMFCIVLYTFALGVPGTCIYSILPEISKGTGISLANLNAGTGYAFLFMGLGNIFFQPLALQIGKRPVYLISCLGGGMFNLWQPWVTSNGEWIASKILAGLFTSPIEALPELSISELYFEHERATYMGIYAVSLYASNYIAPLVAGFINQNSADTDVGGWRWVIFWSIIFACTSFVFLFFFMEETTYERKLKVAKNASGTLAVVTSGGQWEKTHTVVTVNSGSSSSDREQLTAITNVGNQAELVSVDNALEYSPPKTFIQKLSVTSAIQKKFLMWQFIKTTFLMFRFPIVLWGGFLYGSTLIWYTVLNATEAMVLSAPPYNFSSAMCGLAYISPCIFTVLLYFYAGWVVDWLKVKIARKRGGVSEAEDRLWALILYMILGPSSLILWGVGAYHGIHWIGVIIGFGITAGLCIIGCVNAITYVVDCYHEISGEAISAVVVIRNLMSFAVSYGITPWVQNTGLQNTFIASAFICLFCLGTFLIMMATGKYWRAKTGPMFWRMVEERRAHGIYH
ncbi:hypothetical protein FT663_04133 [Candidozyma haemuli var. vulneris]|uniref:Major facilitator superfamily (MFS) profile domain-containing protein n=1 Tax=Candidozyma haemuli TaxID=45357 RepID=A0A2V1APK9_9ASCO|nr:hypothetical protein CXQ85_003512 [[Candida] haemuloni]KAF3987433.1 hypothetical protein FT662_03998 [[Candida] haemuloni var. vulneris]KAF3988187.1 hypothetical protein FT663_04133 [[Candida] haemuloni var. vulneris]PVH19662.1 hypothetical protein CXQ85_003512 [[Candida] haemuloni]